MTKGMTVLDVLVAIAISVILAAILVPCLRAARESADRTTSVSNLKQIYAALALYRNEYDGDGKYGDYVVMGLPPSLRELATHEKITQAVFKSGCPSVRAPYVKVGLFRQMWHADNDSTLEAWAPYAEKQQSAAVLVGDDNCDFRGNDRQNPFIPHRGIGLYEDGSVKTIVRAGVTYFYRWWSN